MTIVDRKRVVVAAQGFCDGLGGHVARHECAVQSFTGQRIDESTGVADKDEAVAGYAAYGVAEDAGDARRIRRPRRRPRRTWLRKRRKHASRYLFRARADAEPRTGVDDT